MINLQPGHGRFTQEADRAQLGPLVGRMLHGRLQKLDAEGLSAEVQMRSCSNESVTGVCWQANLWRAMSVTLLDNLTDTGHAQKMPSRATFLSTYQLESATSAGWMGFTALHYAAIRNDADLVADLLAQGADGA